MPLSAPTIENPNSASSTTLTTHESINGLLSHFFLVISALSYSIKQSHWTGCNRESYLSLLSLQVSTINYQGADFCILKLGLGTFSWFIVQSLDVFLNSWLSINLIQIGLNKYLQDSKLVLRNLICFMYIVICIFFDQYDVGMTFGI